MIIINIMKYLYFNNNKDEFYICKDKFIELIPIHFSSDNQMNRIWCDRIEEFIYSVYNIYF